MPNLKQFVTCLLLTTLITSPMVQADWKDLFKDFFGSKSTQTTAVSTLTTEEMESGLKEALSIGLKKAIDLLGREGGFLNDREVRIPLPSMLQKVDSGLRAVGQAYLADEFIAKLNHAAEQAVPETTAIFVNAIKQMTLDDALGILTGPEDAATQYFRQNSTTHLEAAILPLVKQATEKAGVTAAYKNLVASIGGAGLVGQYIESDSLNLDQYVTSKTLDGLFLKIAQQEIQIRENPLARTTDLLQRVFGSQNR